MEIPKEKILEFLRERGDDDKAAQADRELPEQVDAEEHGDDLLAKYGVRPEEILGKIGGLEGVTKRLGL